MAEKVWEMLEVTPLGGRRKFIAGRPISDPTEIDRLVFNLRDMAFHLEEDDTPWRADLVHQAADKLAQMQRALNSALSRINEAHRG